MTFLTVLPCPVSPRSNRWTDLHALWLKRSVSAQGGAFWELQRQIVISGNMPPKPSKTGVNRQFQAKVPKCENRTISKTANLIKPKFEDKAKAIICTSCVGYHYLSQIQHGWRQPCWKSLWCHNSAADHPIPMKFGTLMENQMAMTVKRSKLKPEAAFQYGGRLFTETGSSNISAVD